MSCFEPHAIYESPVTQFPRCQGLSCTHMWDRTAGITLSETLFICSKKLKLKIISPPLLNLQLQLLNL